MTPKGRPRKGHQVQGDHIVLLVLLFSFDKKCPTFGPKIAQMSYFVLLLSVCVLLFNDGWINDNFRVVLLDFFAATRQEDPTLVLSCYWIFCCCAARRPNIDHNMLLAAKCPCLIVRSWQQGWPGETATAVRSKNGACASLHLHGERGCFSIWGLVHGFHEKWGVFTQKDV